MAKTKISWAGEALNFLTWNCTPVSHGCKNCYARTHAHKFPQNSSEADFLAAPKWRPNALKELAVIKAGTHVFVNTHSDTFHEKNPQHWINDMFRHMNQRPDLIFLLLTKRPQYAELFGQDLKWTDNIWLGTSIESADYMHRLNALQHTPAAHRFISFEPLLSYIPQQVLRPALGNIDWIIVGGESGENYRPFSKQWAMDIQQVAAERNIPFYFKQGSAQFPDSDRLLNGQTYDEYPLEFERLQEKYAVKEVQQSLF